MSAAQTELSNKIVLPLEKARGRAEQQLERQNASDATLNNLINSIAKEFREITDNWAHVYYTRYERIQDKGIRRIYKMKFFDVYTAEEAVHRSNQTQRQKIDEMHGAMEVALKLFRQMNSSSKSEEENSSTLARALQFDLEDVLCASENFLNGCNEDVETRYFRMVHEFRDHRIETDPQRVHERIHREIPLGEPASDGWFEDLQALKKLGPRTLSPSEKMTNLSKIDDPETRKLIRTTIQGFTYDEPKGQSTTTEYRVSDMRCSAFEFANSNCYGIKPMEDTHFAGEIEIKVKDGDPLKVPLFGVYDGHGGDQCSLWVRDNLHKYIQDELSAQEELTEISITNALTQAFVKAHEAYNATGKSAGSTAIAALLIEGNLWVANLGDCRAVISNKGTPIQMSQDHVPEDKRIGKGIYKRGGFVRHDGTIYRLGNRNDGKYPGLGPARVIGDAHMSGVNPRAEIRCIDLSTLDRDSTLILACDGIWDVIGTKDAVERIKSCDSQKVASTLGIAAVDNYAYDNITVLVVPLGPAIPAGAPR